MCETSELDMHAVNLLEFVRNLKLKPSVISARMHWIYGTLFSGVYTNVVYDIITCKQNAHGIVPGMLFQFNIVEVDADVDNYYVARLSVTSALDAFVNSNDSKYVWSFDATNSTELADAMSMFSLTINVRDIKIKLQEASRRLQECLDLLALPVTPNMNPTQSVRPC